jgi:hypothetical protein
MTVEVIEMIEHDDDTITLVMKMDMSTLIAMAQIGLWSVVNDAALKATEVLGFGHIDAEGARDAEAGERSDKPLPE